MNLGLLITRFPPDVIAGAELQMKQVATELARRGHDVTVFTRRYHGRPFLQQQDGYWIRRRRELPLPVLRMVWDMFPALWDIQRHRPRIEALLCYQTLNSGFIGAIAQSLFGIPAVVSIRGNTEYRLRLNRANRLLVPGVYKRIQHLIVQSPGILKDLRAQFEEAEKSHLYDEISHKVSVIPNGLTLPESGRTVGSKIVYVGRLIKGKGVADLILALRQLPGTETMIVGDGPHRPELESLAQGSLIEFIGRVAPSRVPDYLKQARLLVLPSRLGDGLPNVILEAMSHGVPVVTTNTAGMPDVVKHEQTGLLYEPGDIHELTRCIGRVIHDDQLWQRLGENSLEASKSYSWDVVAPQMERVLQEAIRNTSLKQGDATVSTTSIHQLEHDQRVASHVRSQ